MIGAPALRLHGVGVRYGRHVAVHRLSGCFAPGSMTAIVGPNGAGKSSLLRALAGLVGASGPARLEGRIESDGASERRPAYLAQAPEMDRRFPLDCGDLAAAGLWAALGPFAAAPPSAAARIEKALAAVGLAGFARRPIAELSVGRFRRLLFARMLVQDAPVLLLDEPFAALDAATTGDLLRLLQRLHAEGRSVIAALHDLEMVRTAFPDCLLLARAPVAWGPTETVLTAANLHRAAAMVAASEAPAAACERAA